MIKKFIPVLLFFFISIEIFSQVAVPFSVRRQMYVKGDMTMIANNIVNRQEFLNSPNTPYNKIDSKTKLNDEFDMQYIDIDTDKTTFSSSSAKLILDKPEQKKYFMLDYIGQQLIQPRVLKELELIFLQQAIPQENLLIKSGLSCLMKINIMKFMEI